MVQTGQVEYAKRKALECLDAWLATSGVVTPFSGYYYELCGVVEDAVTIGILTSSQVPFEIKDGRPEKILNVVLRQKQS